jgi:hypothetical protein
MMLRRLNSRHVSIASIASSQALKDTCTPIPHIGFIKHGPAVFFLLGTAPTRTRTLCDDELQCPPSPPTHELVEIAPALPGSMTRKRRYRH